MDFSQINNFTNKTYSVKIMKKGVKIFLKKTDDLITFFMKSPNIPDIENPFFSSFDSNFWMSAFRILKQIRS